MRLKRTSLRSITPQAARTLKSAVAYAVEEAGGLRIASERCRVAPSQLSNYGSFADSHEKTFIPLDVAFEIDVLAGEPIILEAYAELHGYRLVPADEPMADDVGEIVERDANKLSLCSIRLAESIHEARADGRIDALERRSIVRHAFALVGSIYGVIRRLGGGR